MMKLMQLWIAMVWNINQGFPKNNYWAKYIMKNCFIYIKNTPKMETKITITLDKRILDTAEEKAIWLWSDVQTLIKMFLNKFVRDDNIVWIK